MISILSVGKATPVMAGFISGIGQYPGVEIFGPESGNRALDMISTHAYDLIIVDEDPGDMTGIAFIKRLVSVNPFINTALVSSLSPDDFHEATEGLGVLMQLSRKPDDEQAAVLVGKLKKVLSLTGKLETGTGDQSS